MSVTPAGIDATAQAELVRNGDVSPQELVEEAIARVEALNPQLNAVIHELFEQGREAAGNSLPEGPFRGVPFLFKDIGAALAGQPYHLGTQVAQGHRLPRPGRHLPRRARFRDAGFVTIGKTNVPELGILPTTESRAYGAGPQPLGPRPHARRLERRRRRGGRLRHGLDRARERRRRVDPDPGQPLRPRRPQADPPADLARAR